MSETTESRNLFDGLNDEIERVTELRSIYAGLPGNGGMPAILITIDPALNAAKKARSEMDVVAMLHAFTALQEITE